MLYFTIIQYFRGLGDLENYIVYNLIFQEGDYELRKKKYR